MKNKIEEIEKEICELKPYIDISLKEAQKIQDEKVKKLKEVLEYERKCTWDDDEEHSSNPIHQSDFIDMQNRIDKIFGGGK